MKTMSYTSFRSHLASTLDQVNDDHTPVMITRQNGKPAILMSVDDFRSYEETDYLLASPKNAERLNQAIADFKSGKIIKRKIIEDEE